MSIWGDIRRRAEGKDVREEDKVDVVINELKKKVDAAALSYVEDCIDAFLQECSLEEFQNHYQEDINIEDDYIVERLKKEDQDLWWDLAEKYDGEYDMYGYPEAAFWRIADEMIPALKEEEE